MATNIWESFAGCECLKLLLIEVGFDNSASLKCINSEELNKIENFINDNREILNVLECEHKQKYLVQKHFKFLPGHVAILLSWCYNLSSEKLNTNASSSASYSHPSFSPILCELINSALSNFEKPANTRRYSDTLIDFSIYVYIMACYKMKSYFQNTKNCAKKKRLN